MVWDQGQRGIVQREHDKSFLLLSTLCLTPQFFVKALMFLRGYKHPTVQVLLQIFTMKCQTMLCSLQYQGKTRANFIQFFSHQFSELKIYFQNFIFTVSVQFYEFFFNDGLKCMLQILIYRELFLNFSFYNFILYFPFH